MYTIECIIIDLVINRTFVESKQYEELEKAKSAFDNATSHHFEEATEYGDYIIKHNTDKLFHIEYGPAIVFVCLKCD